MVVLNKIYTRTGDAGTTALGSGERVPKHALRIAAYGSVDETNAAIGVARTQLDAGAGAGDHADLDAVLARIQNDLFDLGADLCVPEADADQASPTARQRLRVSEAQVERLEAEIDRMNAELEPLRSFVLPGGTKVAAQLHVARTVCRRAERAMVALASEPDERVSAPALKYINRLSDLLFVASRIANDHGHGDVLWVPGQNR
jgi:cob(I)alamin adenosyltransferase